MGILLPPVTQVTTVSTTHLTLHHRNRSLDSALQRIPEVDITPSPECENVAMSMAIQMETPCSNKSQRDELASLGSDDSGILCGSDTGSSASGSSDTNATRESSVEYLTSATQSRESLDDDVCNGDSSSSSKPSNDIIIIKSVDVDAGVDVDVVDGIVVDVDDVDGEDDTVDSNDNNDSEIQVPKPNMGLLLRLLESKMFDVTMAIPYLFQSKEPGVQSYIANKMFSFPDADVDFYLPQLVCMYIQMHDVAEAIHPYLVHRYVQFF